MFIKRIFSCCVAFVMVISLIYLIPVNVSFADYSVDVTAWFSHEGMGAESEDFETGEMVYFNYDLTYEGTNIRIGDDYDYTVTMAVYDLKGSKIDSVTYDNDNNWFGYRFSEPGTYKWSLIFGGDFDSVLDYEVKVKSNDIKAESVDVYAWFSHEGMGAESEDFKPGEMVYFNYDLTYEGTNIRIGDDYDYTVTMAVYDLKGSKIDSVTYDNDNNWFGYRFSEPGVYKWSLIFGGDFDSVLDYEVKVKSNDIKAESIDVYAWFSHEGMGAESEDFKPGETVYFNYDLTYEGTNIRIGDDYDYTVTMAVYDLKGSKIDSVTYDNDNNWFGYRFIEPGTYKWSLIFGGDFDNILNCEVTVIPDSFKFLNDYDSIFNHNNYFLTDNDKRFLSESYNEVDQMLIKPRMNETWTGSCYGMSLITELVYCNKLSPEELPGSPKYLWNAEDDKNDSMESFVNYYQLSQFSTDVIQLKAAELMKTTKSKLKTAIKYANTSTPFLLGFSWKTLGEKGKKINHSHAIVIYGMKKGKYTFNNKTYDRMLLTADPNVEYFKDGCCLYINSENYDWYIPARNVGDSNCEGLIQYIIAPDDTLEIVKRVNHGGGGGGAGGRSLNLAIESRVYSSMTTEDSDFYNILKSDEFNSEFSINRKGSSSSSGSNISSDDEILFFYDAFGENCNRFNAVLNSNPSQSYVLNTQNYEPYNLEMVYENTLLNINSESANNAVFSENSAKIEMNKSSGYVQFTFNEPVDYLKYQNIRFTNQDVDYMSMRHNKSGVLVEASSLKKADLMFFTDIINDECIVSPIRSYGKKALISYNANNELAVQIYGDINGDVNIDSSDVSEMHNYLVGDDLTNSVSKEFIDTNDDCEVNILDLIYLKSMIVEN